VVKGESSRRKLVLLEGVTVEAVMERLQDA